MNKTEFLERLSFFLQDLSSEDRDKVLKYYSNYIDAAGEDKEEETISNLGSINLLAQQIRTEGVEKYEIETPVEIENKEEKQEEQHEEKVIGDSMNHGAATAYSNARSGRNYYSSVAGNNYNSYQNRNDEYNNNKNNYNNYSTNKNNNNSRLLLLLVVIISFPIWFSVLMTVLGCLFGVIVAILGVIFGFGVACVSLIVTGFSLVGVAIWHLVSMPLVSAGLIGCGVLLVGIGLLFMGITLALASKVLPGTVGLIGKMFSSISRRKAGRF